MTAGRGLAGSQLERGWRRFLAAVVGEFPLRSIIDSVSSEPGSDTPIPSVVYQTWVSRQIGRTHFAQWRRFRDLNPEFAFVLFDDAQAGAYMATHWARHPIHEIYRAGRYGPLKTDIFRYCLLAERGGFYFDINKGLDASIRSLLRPGASGLVTYETNACFVPPVQAAFERQAHPEKYVAQWGMGFAPRHPILMRVIDNICAYYPLYKGRQLADPKHGIVAFTGPGMFTKSVREHLANGEDADLVQAGIGFNGHGLWNMKGSYVRYFAAPPYAKKKNDIIVD